MPSGLLATVDVFGLGISFLRASDFHGGQCACSQKGETRVQIELTVAVVNAKNSTSLTYSKIAGYLN